jgi:hypothetical protein
LLTARRSLIWAAALAAALAACSHTATQPILDRAKAQQAYAVGQRLAAQDRAQQAEHRAEMARLIDARVSRTHEHDRTISLLIELHNKSAKRITSADSGIFVFVKGGRRIGMAEIHLARSIAPRSRVSFWYPMRYLRFGEDTGEMVLAAGKPKRVTMDVTEIKYADGSDAGYDD